MQLSSCNVSPPLNIATCLLPPLVRGLQAGWSLNGVGSGSFGSASGSGGDAGEAVVAFVSGADIVGVGVDDAFKSDEVFELARHPRATNIEARSEPITSGTRILELRDLNQFQGWLCEVFVNWHLLSKALSFL